MYYEQLHGVKLDNLEIDIFLEIHAPSRLNHEETEYVNRTMMNYNIEVEIKNSHQIKAKEQMYSLVNSNKHFKKN